MMKPVVGVVLGSESDREAMRPALEVLGEFGVTYEVVVSSAHRQPDQTRHYAKTAEEKGLKVLIAAAGLAAHLPGALASHTTLPVLGVPLPVSSLGGLDSLLSIVQMPGGVPVGALGIGAAGAKNAAFLAVEILALEDRELKRKLLDQREASVKTN